MLLLVSLFACFPEFNEKYLPEDQDHDYDNDGMTELQGDCNDVNPQIYLGAIERCDGFDNDCDGYVDVGAIDSSLWYRDNDGDAYYSDDTLSADVNSAGEIVCSNCPEGRMKGSDEWLDLFNREVLVSPFQDGHYIYIVIPGGGSGSDVKAPRICVADGESPKHLHKIMDL